MILTSLIRSKEFIPYEQAFALKNLGFNEQYFGYTKIMELHRKYDGMDLEEEKLGLPLYQQAFRWFRENHELASEVSVEQYRRNDEENWMFSITYLNNGAMYEHGKTTFETYEEAELACLKRLIEIVKSK